MDESGDKPATALRPFTGVTGGRARTGILLTLWGVRVGLARSKGAGWGMRPDKLSWPGMARDAGFLVIRPLYVQSRCRAMPAAGR